MAHEPEGPPGGVADDDEDTAKTATVQAKVTPAEKARIVRVAKSNGRKTSDWARRALLAAAAAYEAAQAARPGSGNPPGDARRAD